MTLRLKKLEGSLMHIEKTKDEMKGDEMRKVESKNSGCFKKGHLTWNKNLKGIHLSPDSEFKKGKAVGDKHPCWGGGRQVMSNDCVLIWDGVGKRIRSPRLAYESRHGAIPDGFVIYHIDGDRYNDDVDNLEAISRGELMRRNANDNA